MREILLKQIVYVLAKVVEIIERDLDIQHPKPNLDEIF